MNAPQIITLPIKDIKPYWRNPRINKRTVALVKKSIQDYGYNQLIAVDRKGVIIAGHARWLALRELGWDQVPVMVLDLGEKKARAYRIVDNKTAEFSTWSSDLVRELQELDLEPLEDYFHGQDLTKLLETSAGQAHELVGPAAMEQARSKLESQFNDRTDYQDVVCPGCGREFKIKPSIKRVEFSPGKEKAKALQPLLAHPSPVKERS